jgi:hypothetical protein
VGHVRGLFVATDHSLAERLRRKRWSLFRQQFPDFLDMRVLDLGGTASWWRRAPERPKSLTLINLAEFDESSASITAIQGDACAADELLPGASFDLVFSNSLVEHLGGHAQRLKFAEVVHKMAPSYWVQTPYRYFPVEPHWVFPLFQFIPMAARVRIAPKWPVGHTHRWDSSAARDEVMFTELLSATELRTYFPDGQLLWERLGGVPKSMMITKA